MAGLTPLGECIHHHRPQQADGLGGIPHLAVAVIDQPVGHPAAIPQDLPQAPAGDQPSSTLAEQQAQRPGRILRIGLVEVLHQGCHLGAGAGDTIQLIKKGLKGLHGFDPGEAILTGSGV